MDTNSLLTSTTTQQAQNAYASGMQARATSDVSTQSPQNLAKVKAAAQQFEGFFVGQMMEYMTAGIKADGTFGGGQAEDTWRSMLNQEYGKEIAKSGRLGVTDSVMKGMLQAQEQRTAAQTAAKQALAAENTTPTITTSDVPAGVTDQAAAAAGTLAAATKTASN